MARTIYLGSAPTATAAHRGLGDRRIKLGCVMPGESPGTGGDASTTKPGAGPAPLVPPKRFHGSVVLDPPGSGRDASRIADEVIVHLVGLVGATVKVTLEVDAETPAGAPDHVVRTVTENSRTLRFTSQGFETE